MTEHPAKKAGCTKNQIDAFEQICIGNHLPRASQKTLQALVDKGLVFVELKTVGVDRFGAINVSQYYVDLGSQIHIQWCQWCSEQPDIVDHLAVVERCKS